MIYALLEILSLVALFRLRSDAHHLRLRSASVARTLSQWQVAAHRTSCITAASLDQSHCEILTT
jgi:hypothetical protein